jgi:hypothetical protein
MFAKLAKLAELRALDPRHAAPRPIRLVHSRDNQPSVRLATVRRQSRRQVLVCQWHSVPGDGRLECSWHIEPDDGSPGECPRGKCDMEPVTLVARHVPGRGISPLCSDVTWMDDALPQELGR